MAIRRKPKELAKQGPTMLITVRPFPWDLGPKTALQVENKVVEEVTHLTDAGKLVNPNEVIRTRREPWILTYGRKGKLSKAQTIVAVELLDASLGLVQQDPLIALRLERGGFGRDVEAERVDARRKFRKMWALIPAFARPVIEHVVINNCSLRSMPGCSCGASEARHLVRLQKGLQALSDEWRT